MAVQKIELGSKGIRRVLRKYKPEEAIAEYVWNGYDATATRVSINILQNSIGGIEEINVSDNGYGIPFSQLNTKFKPFFESNKIIVRNSESNSSSYHGKNGVGRLTFFTFAGQAEWETIYEKEDKKYKYTIYIDGDGLNDYTATEPEEVDQKTELGTTVRFFRINEDFQVDTMKHFLKVEFCWFLELMKNNEFQLLINHAPIDYSEILEDRDVRKYKYNDVEFDVVFCRWAQKLNGEYSKYYYLDENNKEKFKENTTLNNKGDNFYHSVYITSALFDDFDFSVVTGQMRLKIAGNSREDEIFKYIKREIDNLIREKRIPFIKKYAKRFLKTVEEKEAYPDFDECNPVDRFKKECLDELISTVYYVEPKILSGLNKPQLKTLIRMFALIMESGERDSFIKIIDSVVNMSQDERTELAEALEYTTMSNISRTIIMLKDRAQAVADLKELVFNKELGAGEINAIQPFIEKHYWLFGEQYHLVTAEEPDFEEALRRYIYILGGVLMSVYDSPFYDEPRSWIQKKRAQNIDWDIIRIAKKKSNTELIAFLNSQHEDNDWPKLSIDDWDSLVNECRDVETQQESILFRGNDGALFDRSQDNNLKIPENPRSCWQLYKNNLKWKEQSIKDLEYATIGILRRLSIDTRETGPIKGLVVGHVQSGKTANMEALMAMCADHGWNMFIVLSGSIENLRLQTLRRMEKDLNQEGNLVWRGIEHPSKKSNYGERAQDLNFSVSSSQRFFTVCLKNVSRLKKLIEWIHENKAAHDQMKILIIDDEADQASISNTAVDAKTAEKERKERKGINKLIVDLVNDQHHKGAPSSKGKAQAINYVMYTATPYANFLNEATPESLYPHDFIWTLKTSDEYIGPNQIYGTSEPEFSDGLDIKRPIMQEDLDIISEIYEYNTTEVPKSMKDAICWFICAVAVMRYWGYDKPISMLVHTSQKQVCHDAVADVISTWINSVRAHGLVERCAEVYDKEIHKITKQDWLMQFAGGYGVDESEIRDYPSFDNITPYISELLKDDMKHIKMSDEGDLQYHAGLHLVIDNCSKNGISNGDDYVRLAYPEPGSENYPKPAPAFIIVGGSTLSRGLTIEGLVSTFFLRASCQADTLMQMGRWFGYRRGYELMPRVWMTDDTIQKFRFLSQLEIDLREDLKKYMVDGVCPDEYGPRIILSPKVSWLRLTSRNHMRNAVNAEMNYSGAKPQTTIFENSVTKQKQNIICTEEFLSSLPGQPTVSTQKNSIFWENISLDLIYKKLLYKRFSFSNRSRVFNEIEAFCEWIKQVLKDDTLDNWTVIVAGRDNVDDLQQKNDLGYWTVAGHTIGKVNRSKRNIEDETCIDIGVLRSIKDLLADIDKKYLEGYGNITKQEQVDEIRKAAGKDTVPILVIYRISAKSTARQSMEDVSYKNGTPDRVDLNFGSDIIGIQICIPGDQVNKSFTKKVTVYLPSKDKEDEVEENHGN